MRCMNSPQYYDKAQRLFLVMPAVSFALDLGHFQTGMWGTLKFEVLQMSDLKLFDFSLLSHSSRLAQVRFRRFLYSGPFLPSRSGN
ncbi:hypothetical protein Plhal304r1_c020g0071891 [Plasmopara halstedii]